MGNKTTYNTRTIYIKNLVCNSSRLLLKDKLEEHNIQVLNMDIGKAKIKYKSSEINTTYLDSLLKRYDLHILTDKNDILVLQIKSAAIELIHELNNMNSIVRKSDYLVEKLGHSYQHLSKIFSEHENITLEKYIIQLKIERIKQLIDNKEYTLSEIAYMMDYSSVQYLSNQFKKVTGKTVSEYKTSSTRLRRPIDKL